MRLRPALVLLPVFVLLAGCAPTPASTPTPSATTAPPSPSPTPTRSATPAPTPTETSEPPQSDAEFTSAQLVELCTANTKALAPDATYFPDMATAEWLDQPSLWFVVIPKTLNGQDSVAVCGIGGSPDAPDVSMHGESLPNGVAEIRQELLTGTSEGDS